MRKVLRYLACPCFSEITVAEGIITALVCVGVVVIGTRHPSAELIPALMLGGVLVITLGVVVFWVAAPHSTRGSTALVLAGSAAILAGLFAWFALTIASIPTSL